MAQEKIFSKINMFVFILLIAAIVFPFLGELHEGLNVMTDENYCNDNNGVWNTTNSISCHAPTNVSLAVEHTSVPFGNNFSIGATIAAAAFVLFMLNNLIKPN